MEVAVVCHMSLNFKDGCTEVVHMSPNLKPCPPLTHQNVREESAQHQEENSPRLNHPDPLRDHSSRRWATTSYQSIQTSIRPYHLICLRDVWASHEATPAHDNACDGMIIHPPVCGPRRFQPHDKWGWRVCLRARHLIIEAKMAACLPWSDSSANFIYTALKIKYCLVVGYSDRLHGDAIPCDMALDTQDYVSAHWRQHLVSVGQNIDTMTCCILT